MEWQDFPVSKRIPGSAYAVSEYGQVNRVEPGKNTYPGKALKPALIHGYPMVCIYTNGKKRTVKVATLVLETFVGPRPEGLEGCHDDGDKNNSHRSNLRWDTHVENCADRDRHGTTARGERNGSRTKPHRVPRGERAYNAKVTDIERREIRALALSGEISQRKIAKRYGISQALVRYIMLAPFPVRVRTPKRAA